MSRQYWVRSSAHSQVEGPYTSEQLRQRAADGELTRSALVSLDQTTWHAAAVVKGLFQPASTRARARANPVAPARPTAVASTPIAEARIITDTAAPPVPTASSLGYYSLGDTVANARVRRRSPIAFTIIAGLMFLSGVSVSYLAYFGTQASSRNLTPIFVALGSTCAFLLLAIPALVLWLTWVYGIHKDLAELTGRQYSITPAQAAGFSLIPLFDAFWVVYMPYRAAGELNRHLTGRGLPVVSQPAVMACQIGSIVTALFLPGLMPVLYAASMWQVQSGLNRLSSG